MIQVIKAISGNEGGPVSFDHWCARSTRYRSHQIGTGKQSVACRQQRVIAGLETAAGLQIDLATCR